MARNYAGSTKSVGTTGFSTYGIPTAAPYSIYCMLRAPNVTAEGYCAGVGRITGGNAVQLIGARGDIAGDPLIGYFVSGAADNVQSSAYSANVWTHATVVQSSSTASAIYNGTAKTTKTINASASGAQTVSVPVIGVYPNGDGTYSAYFGGQVCRFAWWSAALTDDEVAALNKGFSPRFIRRGALEIYVPNVREAIELCNNNVMTDNGAVYDHPPVIGR